VDGREGYGARAVDSYKAAIALCEAHGDVWIRSQALGRMGVEIWRLGDATAALEVQRNALRMRRDLADWPGTAVCLHSSPRSRSELGTDRPE
jgi:hypothetical protein